MTLRKDDEAKNLTLRKGRWKLWQEYLMTQKQQIKAQKL